MDFWEMRKAVKQAQDTICMCERYVREMADLCAGRLRLSRASHYTLRALKRELRDFNMTTGVWKENS